MLLDLKEISDLGVEIFVQRLNERFITGYTILKDIYGKPVLLVKVDMPRDIYQQGKLTMHYYSLSLLSVGFVVVIVMLLLLDKLVLSRLIRLNSNVKNIAESGDVSKRVEVEGNDEISSLAKEVNSMLASLEKSQREIRRALKQEKEFKRKTAHYFFNPICIAKGFLELARKDEGEDNIEKALDAIERIENVIKNIVMKGEIRE